eukprot:TRINITY_DN44091_c0_g1_i1.p1 TRINITY_DN44091_c0_g1~~TRINITY_DN44091_c0_g1_i1.p1  ORF type:complete len:343 (-),score=47.36 TRINITY_DN44091_c0_g1_i1:120-1148(-)
MELTHLSDAVRRALPEPTRQARLLAMLQAVDELMERACVPYWVTGGTLLGAIRHAGFIPHDDDIDIEVREVDWPRAEEALGAVGRSYMGLSAWIGRCDRPVSMGRIFFWGPGGSTFESIDVFLRESALCGLAEFPSREEIFPLRRVAFHDIMVNVPKESDAFLSRCYETSCLDEVIVWGHSARGRTLFCAPLAAYVEAVASAGYVQPTSRNTYQESLASVGLDCKGELKEHQWRLYGWASPYVADVADDDPCSLEMLGLESHCLLLDLKLLCVSGVASENLVRAAEMADLQLVARLLKEQTGAFVNLEGRFGQDNTVRPCKVVGTPEEIASVKNLVLPSPSR